MNTAKRAKTRGAKLFSAGKPKLAKASAKITETNSTIAATNENNNINDKNNIAVTSAPQAECCSALLVVGTYHSVMAGLVYRREKFAMLFSIKHHEGCVNSVAIGDKYMVSSGTDERVFIFTNKNHQAATSRAQGRLSVSLADLGHLLPPSEARCLLLTQHSQHMLCGCADGQLVVYRTRDWSVGLALHLHEKAVAGIAVHPRSDGALAVTIGEDCRVAVMDLAKGRLLSKWHYCTSLAGENVSNTYKSVKKKSQNGTRNRSSAFSAVDVAHSEKEEEEEEEEGQQQSKRVKLEMRDIPRAVKFSPSGKYFTILSGNAFAIYETSRMCLVARYVALSAQPRDELHVFAFVDDNTIIFGNESGEFMGCCGPWSVEDTQPRECTPQRISTQNFSELSQSTADDKRHPKYHTTRLKALHCVEKTVFSLDAAGVVIAWHVESNVGVTMTFKYVCSANCQGRVTTMDVLPL